VLSEPDLWWQGGEDAGLLQRHAASQPGKVLWSLLLGSGPSARGGILGRDEGLVPGKEHLAPRRNVWALEKHLVLEMECLWCGGPKQDCGPAAAPQGWEHSVVPVLRWGRRRSAKSP